MKVNKYINLKFLTLGLTFLTILSCERELSSDAEFATFPQIGEIFTDTPIGLGSDFYFPFLGSKLTAFSVEQGVSYEGSASMRFDVPNEDDPEGNYAGAIFRIDGAGRDLTQFDALTFWAKASQGVVLGEMGFGQDFEENKYQVTATNLSLSTNWVKYIIPIPDPSKLIEERGMFWYSAGTQGTGGLGYTFWLDEVRFEKLGTLGQPKPAILNGEVIDQEAFIDVPVTLTGLKQTFNLASGQNQTVLASPSYFDFNSTDIEVARVSETGIVSVVSKGQATITATLGNVEASGSLNLDVIGSFDFAPIPPIRDPNDVVCIYSDAYQTAEIEYYNGFFNPDGQTTLGGNIIINDNNNVIRYTDLNFVALKTTNTVDASGMENLHFDIKVEDSQIDAGDFITFILLAQNPDGTEDQASITISTEDLVAGQWIPIERPLSDFVGVTTSNLSLFFFVSDFTVNTILVDNIYFYN
jgi:hypothetical protein